MGRKLTASVFGYFLFAVLLNGQELVYTATAPSVVRVGEQFQYVVEGSERGDMRLPSMQDFQLLGGPYSSFSSHSQWVNGKMNQKTLVSYTYVFRAVKEGDYTIRAATVKVGRKEYLTNEVVVVVSAGSSPGQAAPSSPGSQDEGVTGSSAGSDPVFLRVIPSKKEVYMGEQFVSGLKVYTRVNTRPASSSRDIPYEGFFKNSVDPDETAQQQEIGGQAYVTQVIQRHILIPQKSGKLMIPPYESEWMVPQRVERQGGRSAFDSFFDDPFFNGYQDVPVKLSTLPVSILVKPLPSGAPAGFTGAVGEFTMSASLSASEMEVNEALSLKITISGTGNLPLLGEPEVNLPPDHDLYDVSRSLKSSTSGNRITGSVTFEYPIVARHAGRYRIAPVQFAWFDPKAASYRTATTGEFSFTVLKGENEETTVSVYVPGVAHESVRNLGTDIRDITRRPPVFTAVAASIFGTGWYRWLYPVAIFVALILVILIRMVTRRNADLSLVRNRKAGRAARSRLKKADRLRKAGDADRFYEEIGKAIWGYLSHKMNLETSELSREVVIEQLDQQEVPEKERTELLRILEDSEFSRFAPTSERTDMNLLYRDAAKLISLLENSLK
ncbi:MAG: protein BatD [Bacteroidales bacterium]|nr:protein BatD [Bacteroidales bacterium]